MIRHYENLGYSLSVQRLKTPFAEIDLVFETPEDHFLMVEVKSVRSVDFIPYRISQKQKQRQFRALMYLHEQTKKLVEAHWAFVTDEKQILILKDIT